MSDPVQQTVPPKKSGCSWYVIIPVGCLGIMVLCGGGFGAIFYGVMAALKASTPYVESVKRMNESQEVKDALGTPIEIGSMASGKIDDTNGQGTADITIPLTGPKGPGTLHVVGTSQAGKWTYSTMNVEAGGKTIDLLAGKAEPVTEPK